MKNYTPKEQEEILKMEKEAKEEIEQTVGLRDRFALYRKYSTLFDHANKIRDIQHEENVRRIFNETGKCPHCFRKIYDSHRSTLQDSECVVCGEINTYLGDD